MKSYEQIMKEPGVEIPEGVKEHLKQQMLDNYKAINDYNKTTAARDEWKKRAETAEETLKSFDGIDPEKIQNEIGTWKKKAEDAEKDYNAKLEERDFNDALKEALDGMKFSSSAARKAIEADIKSRGLKISDGKILGLNDLIAQMKESDADAFVDDNADKAQSGKAVFTAPMGNRKPTGKTKDEIMSIRDRAERQKEIAANMHLFPEFKNE